MNALFGLLAAPAATSALDLAGRTADAASAPFELLMQMAMKSAEPTAAVEELAEESETESLQQQVARQLQELLQSLGIAPGDRVTIEVDNATGDLEVGDDHPLAGPIEAALDSDAQLEENIRRLAEQDALFGAAPFAANSKLQVEVAEEQSSALLEWR